MGRALIIQLAAELIWLVLLLSLPTVIAASVIGILIGLVQALTQIQDQTISYLFKLAAICITLAATYHWMGNELIRYTERCFDLITQMVH